MNKELTTIEPSKFTDIITKVNDPEGRALRVIDDRLLQQISDFMPEINRAVAVFGKNNSQTTASLMVLGMLESGPYRVLRQILVQIQKKRDALKENLYKHAENKLKWERFSQRLEKLTRKKEEEVDKEKPDELTIKEFDLTTERFNLKMKKIEYDLADSTIHIEACMKEVGAYQERYKEICKNYGLSERWDEEDFEAAEVEHHIKSMFRNAIRDKMQGQPNQGTMEYFEQFGINPITAYKLVEDYINRIDKAMAEDGDRLPDITSHYKFFDQMYETFKNEYKKAAARIGLDSITQADFLMKENK